MTANPAKLYRSGMKSLRTTTKHVKTGYHEADKPGAAARGVGQILGYRLTPAQAAIGGGAGGLVVAAGAARSHQNKRLRRIYLKDTMQPSFAMSPSGPNVGKSFRSTFQSADVLGRKATEWGARHRVNIDNRSQLRAEMRAPADAARAERKAVYSNAWKNVKTENHRKLAESRLNDQRKTEAKTAKSRADDVARRIDARHKREAVVPGTSNVGKRLSGGSFDRGPSTVVMGQTKRQSRRGTVGRFGSGSSHASKPKALERYAGPASGGRQLQIEMFHSSPVRKAAMFTPTSVLTRAKPLDPSLPTLGQQAGPVGTQNKPGVLVPSAPAAGGNGTAAQALGGAKATPVQASGKIKAAVATGSVGSAAATKVAKLNPYLSGLKDFALSRPGAFTGGVLATRAEQEIKRRRKPVAKADNYSMPVRVFGPRPRAYDPESARQRRLGRQEAVTGAGGLAAGGAGIAHINRARRNSSIVRGIHAPKGRMMPVTARGAVGVGVGAAGIAASRKIHRYADDPRNREWG